MKRPLVVLVIFYILGIIVGRYLNDYFGIVYFSLIILIFNIYLFFKFRWIGIVLLFVFYILGIIKINMSISERDKVLNELAVNNRDVVLNGTVLDLHSSNDWYNFIFKVESYEFNNTLYKSSVKVKAIVKITENIKDGDNLTLKGELLLLDFARNPGGYNEWQYLKTRNVSYKIFPNEVYQNYNKNNLNTTLKEIRNKFQQIYFQVLPENEASIISSIVIGDRSFLSNETKSLYQMSGIYHILAISGLHLYLISLGVAFILEKIFSQRVSILLTMLFLILYCNLTGNSVATLRAVIMFSTGAIGKIIYKKGDSITTLALAAFLILIFQPLFLFDVGFQFSFGAVLALIYSTFTVSKIFSIVALKYTKLRFLNKPFILKYFVPSVAVYLSLTPIFIYNFYYLNFYSVFLNLFVLTSIPFIILGGFMIIIFYFIKFNIAVFMGGIVYFLLNIYEFLSKIVLMLPFSLIVTGKTNLIVIFMLSALIIFINYIFHLKGNNFIKFRKIAFYCIVIFIVAFMGVKLLDNNLKVVMLDVGQGDAFVITKQKTTFIIDAGGNRNKNLGDNTGVNVVSPYLKSEGINFIDGIFITHGDFDHIGGVLEIIDLYKVGCIYLPVLYEENSFIKELYEKAEYNNIQIQVLEKGDLLTKGNISFRCINSGSNISENDSCLVLKLVYKNIDFLFTGDISTELEEILLNEDINLTSEVLKVAHHGSKYSSSEEFVKAVAPKIAIVSSGKNNSYGHPGERVVDLFDELNVNMYNTADYGAVIISTNGNIIKVKTMRDRYLMGR